MMCDKFPCFFVLPTLLFLFGCQPETSSSQGETVLSGNQMMSAQSNLSGSFEPASDGPPPVEQLEPGVPEDPKPGIPDEPPPPGGAGAAGGQGPPPGPPPAPTGPSVLVKGTVEFEGYTGGPIQIDIMDGPSTGPSGSQPKVVTLERLDKPGEFEIRVAANAGEIYLQAFNDADENGRPDREDPRGEFSDNPVEVEDEDVAGVLLTLSVEKQPPPPGGF